MKTLVAYYSFTGNNAKLANYLKDKMGCDIFAVQTQKKMSMWGILMSLIFRKKVVLQDYKIDLKAYDKIVLVSSVWFGNVAFPFKTFLQREKDNIKNYQFISICLGGQKENLEKALTKIIEKPPEKVVEISFKKLKEENKLKTSDKLSDDDFDSIKKDIDQVISN